MPVKKILVIMYNYSTLVHLVKDPGAYAYSLSRYAGWSADYAYFASKEISDDNFERYCGLVYLGKEDNYNKQYLVVKRWLQDHIDNYSVLMLFNYGGNTYKTANEAKRINSNIKIYSKLDMNENGFTHFYDGSFIRKMKSSIEVFKNRNVDLFTVENKYYKNILERQWPFLKRIQYLPNCVSLLNIDMEKLDHISKENIILTVGRLGDWHKHNELLIEAIERFSKQVGESWKVYLVGPITKEFSEYLNKKIEQNNALKEMIVLTGAVMERQKLYELYARAKIFVLTSRSESFGIAVIESMYFGSYPVLTEYGTIVRDITNEGKCGDIVPQNDCEALAAKLQELMSDSDLLKKGMDAKVYARRNFSYEYWACELDRYLSEVL